MRSIASIAAVASLAVLGGVTTTRAAPAEPQGNQVMLGFWFDSADRKLYFNLLSRISDVARSVREPWREYRTIKLL